MWLFKEQVRRSVCEHAPLHLEQFEVWGNMRQHSLRWLQQAACGESCTKLPDALRINWKDASPCEHVSNLSPLVKTAQVTCTCLGALSEFLSHVDDFQSSEPSSVALKAGSSMASCLVKEGFNVQNNKPSVLRDFYPSLPGRQR